MTTYVDNLDADSFEQKTPQQSDNSADLQAGSSTASEDDSEELLG